MTLVLAAALTVAVLFHLDLLAPVAFVAGTIIVACLLVGLTRRRQERTHGVYVLPGGRRRR